MRDTTWYGMTEKEAYKLARPASLVKMRKALTPFKDRKPELRMSIFHTIQHSMSHSETVVADIEFKIFED